MLGATAGCHQNRLDVLERLGHLANEFVGLEDLLGVPTDLTA